MSILLNGLGAGSGIEQLLLNGLSSATITDSVMVSLTSALKTSIDGGSFSQAFTNQRIYLPQFDVEELADSIRVSIVPNSSASLISNRNGKAVESHIIQIAVQKKVANDVAEIDDLMLLVQELYDHLRQNDLTVIIDQGTATLVDCEVDPIFIPDHLKAYRVFTSVITATYKIGRD